MSLPAVNKPRAIFATHNKFQREIIILAFFPSALIFLTFICMVILGNLFFCKALFHRSFPASIDLVNKLSGLMVFFMCLIFVLTLIGAYIVSHNMIGAYGRILRELDEIIAGRSTKTISSRPNDTLTKELLKRINVLIKSYVAHQHKNS